METRKIQRVSNGTYTVSLPREWATDQGLSAGEEVELHTHRDGTLVVQPAEGDAARVDLRVTDETPTELRRLLRAAYATGALEVHVAAEEFGDERRAAVRSTVRALSGVTIAEASDDAVAVRNVLDSEQVSIRQSVRHLRFVALSRHREATAALCDPAVEAGTAADDGRVDRLSAVVERYVVRSLSRLDEVDRLGESRPDLFCFHRLAAELRRVGACADRIATVADAGASASADGADESVAAADEDRRAEFEAVAADAREAVETAVDTVFATDPDAVWTVFDARDGVVAGVDDLQRRCFEAPGGDYRVARALPAVRETAACAAAIAVVGLRRGLRTGAVDAARAGDGDPEAAGGPVVPTETDG